MSEDEGCRRGALVKRASTLLVAVWCCLSASSCHFLPETQSSADAARRAPVELPTDDLAGPPAPPPTHPTARARRLLETGPVDGIVLGLFSQDPSFDYTELLLEIRDTGSRWVSLMVNNYQELNDSTTVGVPDSRTARLERVRSTVHTARDLGFHVLLFPILLLQKPGEKDWRGTIAPTDHAEWHRSYREMLTRYARVAEAEGVDLLSIGSEFNSLQVDREEWAETIAHVRHCYSGPITYSANWDSLETVSFLPLLDLVGMTTYFGLSDEDDPSVDTMAERWAGIRGDLQEWRFVHTIPLLFTEVGYPSQNGANRNPWNYFHSETPDLEEQRDCFEAFSRVWIEDPQLSGVLFYNWFGEGGEEDTGYTVRGKPALDLVEAWFRQRDPRRRDASARAGSTVAPDSNAPTDR
ncbi:MAG: hypothetical protein KDC38_21160 [Planctomycetes bacterium]|nr:hypothetical protein [Planctomycetota bacterium]